MQPALSAVAPGGSLHIADFGCQEDMPPFVGRLLRAWLAKFHVEPRAELETDLGEIAGNATIEFEKLYRDYARLAVVRPA